MRLNKPTFYALVLSLVLFNLILRYPLDISHEMGSDTSFIHSLAASLVREGEALWVLHPLSYFGLYALSYPSAIPFLSAGTHLVADVPIEGTFLIIGFLFGVIGPLGMVLVGRSLTRDNRFALFLALVMSLAPFYIKDTMWIGASRGFVVALVPFLLFLCIRVIQTRSTKALFLLVTVVVMTSTIHRMGVLSLFVLIATIFVLPFHKVTQNLRFMLLRYDNGFRVTSLALSIAGFLGMFFLQFQFPGIAGADVRAQYGSGTFFEGDSFGVLVLNMSVSFLGKVGILFPLAAAGLVMYIWKRPKEAPDKFLLLAVLIFLPLLSMRDYITEFVIPFLAVLIVFAIFRSMPSLRKRQRAVAAATAIAIVIGAGAFAWIMKGYWADRYATDAAIPDETYTASVYVRYHTQGTILTNYGLTGGRITAISERPTLPLGGASLHWFSSQQLIFNYIDGRNVQVVARDLFTLNFNTDDLFAPVNVRNAQTDWETVLYGHLADVSVSRLRDRYDSRYIFLDNEVTPARFISYGLERDSPFIREVLVERYAIFSYYGGAIYFLG